MSTAPPADVPPRKPSSPLLTPAFLRLLLVQVVFGTSYSLFLVLPKHLTEGLGARPREVGLVMAAFGLANVVLAPALGRLVARRGPAAALRIACLAMAAGAIGFAFVGSPGLAAAALRGLQGAAWGLVFTASSGLAASLAPPTRLPQMLGLAGSAGLLMNAVGPPVAEWLLATGGPSALFATGAAAALLAWAAAAGLRADAPGAGLRADAPAAGLRADAPAVPAAAVRVDALGGGSRTGVILYAVAGTACGAVFSFHQPLALARGVMRLSDFFVAFTVAALAVRLGGGRFFARHDAERTARAALFVYGLVAVAVAAVGPVGLAWLGFGFGAAHGVFYPTCLAMTVERAGPARRAAAVAAANGAFSLGLVGVLGLGALAELAGYPVVFVLVGLATCAAAVVRRSR